MITKFGGLPWQLFFSEKPSFSNEDGEILLCRFTWTKGGLKELYDHCGYIDSIAFPTSIYTRKISREEQFLQFDDDIDTLLINYKSILDYFNEPCVKTILQKWIFKELDKANRTDEKIEPFNTLSRFLGESFFQTNEEKTRNLSEMYVSLFLEEYIPPEGVKEIEKIMMKNPIDNDPIPFNVRAFFKPLEDEGLVKRVGDYWIILQGYNLNEFIGIMNAALDQSRKIIEFDIPGTDKEEYLRKENGERYSHGTWDKGEQPLTKRKKPLPIPEFMR